jgi:serine/threonine/tyrosine-interacting-like protein 1
MLLIDARERADYDESHILTAKWASKNNNDEFVAPFDSDLECKSHVVIYDSHTSSLDDDESPGVICGKKMWDSGSRNLVEILNGGYEAFSALYPFHRTQKIIYMPRELDEIQTFPSEIIPGLLYVGNWKHGNIPYIQKELRIMGHINCCEQPGTFLSEEGSSLLHIAVSDVPVADLFTRFAAAVDFINHHKKSNQVVLIYSKLGISRSATIAVAYLMHENSWSLEDAYRCVKKCRPQICPNTGFMKQLAQWNSKVSRKQAEGVTDSVYLLDLQPDDQPIRELTVDPSDQVHDDDAAEE